MRTPHDVMKVSAKVQGNLKILCMLSILNDARDSKRISMLQDAGFGVEAIALDRGFRKGRHPKCNVKLIGNIRDGHYLERIVKIIAALNKVRHSIRLNDIIYASGIDMALTGIVAGLGLNKPLIIEVGDLRKIQVSRSLLSKAERLLERYICSRSSLIIATATGFIDGYYRGKLNSNRPSIIIENKLEASLPPYDPTAADNAGLPLINRALRIGYFGMLRCEWSWKILEKLAKSEPEKIQIVVAGRVLSPHDLPSRAAKLKNITFRGEYNSPDDLSNLYGSVDMVWVCYPGPNEDDPDWQWAQAICRSNRFYESCFFRRPMITLACSADGTETLRHDLGLVISGYDINETVRMIMQISSDDIARWGRNLARLPRETYVMINEQRDLAAAISKNAIGNLSKR